MTRRAGHVVSGMRHWLAVTACVGGLALGTSPAVQAEPDNGTPAGQDTPGAVKSPGGSSGGISGPFPDNDFVNRYYESVKYDDYFTNSAGGVWFSTPLGLNCGIWDRGAFGCSGDIRGGPPGTTNVGWVSGQIRVRYDPGFAFLVPPGKAERELPPRTYIRYNGTTCTTMTDQSTYCSRGPYEFFVTPTRTWLNPP